MNLLKDHPPTLIREHTPPGPYPNIPQQVHFHKAPDLLRRVSKEGLVLVGPRIVEDEGRMTDVSPHLRKGPQIERR